jgi:hypothetical protein
MLILQMVYSPDDMAVTQGNKNALRTKKYTVGINGD